MKKIYLLLITVLLTITLSVTTVKASNGTEIIPFHPDPSLVTEWVISNDTEDIEGVIFDTPILKVIIPEPRNDLTLTFSDLESTVTGEGILWIYPAHNNPINMEMSFYDSYISTIWFGGGQTITPTLRVSDFYSANGNGVLENIYIYPDAFIAEYSFNTSDFIEIFSYNFEYELNRKYQLGYNDGWAEKNKMTDITFLIIGLIIFIIANVLGFIYKNNLLTALSGLLWLLPIFLVDNIFIKIFSVIIMLITFLFSFKERGEYYV